MNKQHFNIMPVVTSSSVTAFLVIIGARMIIQQQEKMIAKLNNSNKVLCKTVQLFATHSSMDIIKKVKDEVEFDWIVKDLDFVWER